MKHNTETDFIKSKLLAVRSYVLLCFVSVCDMNYFANLYQFQSVMNR